MIENAQGDPAVPATTAEPQDAAPWLDMLKDAEKTFERWHEVADRVDEQAGTLERLALVGDREFQIFYANLEVLKGVVYARPPVPVAKPRFSDRRATVIAASDMIERALMTDVDIDGLHDKLELARDDMLIPGRGVVWVDLDNRRGKPAPVARHICRKDFRHGPSRKWNETPWVAKRAYVDRETFAARFGEIDGVQFEKHDLGESDESKRGEEKAAVWEIWHKAKNVVVWVSEGVDRVLDERPPLVSLEGFFPCPRPAYANVERETLIPIPDFAYYRDQVEEINELTGRVSALCEGLRLKGFYSGGSDVTAAIEQALQTVNDRALLIPVENMAAFGSGEGIVWLPLEMVAATIQQLVLMRRQLIEDVYQITGLSDIMRGATNASETATAQEIKAQYGSVRAKRRQAEMERLARDVLAIKAEIMAEDIDMATLFEWSQVQLPTVQQLQQQFVAEQRPQMQEWAAQQAQALVAQGADPAVAQVQANAQAMQQAQQFAAQKAQQEASFESVETLLRNKRIRPFLIEIETDSTIVADDVAEKQRRSEFLQAVGGFLREALPALEQAPMMAPFLSEALRFTASGFRPGRQMDAAIDELAEAFVGMAQQQPDEAQAQAAKDEAAAKQQEVRIKAAEAQAGIDKMNAETDKIRRETQLLGGPEDERQQSAA